MGTTPEHYKHQTTSSTPAVETIGARELLTRQLKAREADVAAQAAQLFDERNPVHEESSVIAFARTIACLNSLTEERVLSKPIGARGNTQLRDYVPTRNHAVAKRLPKNVDSIITLKLTVGVRSNELRILLGGLTLVGREYGCEDKVRAIRVALADVLNQLTDPSPREVNNAQKHLESMRSTIHSTVQELEKIFLENAPERREERRAAAIERAVTREQQTYRTSPEYRSLKLLALIESRPDTSLAVTAAEIEIATKLLPVGVKNVESLLRERMPPLQVTQSAVLAIREIFHEASRKVALGREAQVSAEGHPDDTPTTDALMSPPVLAEPPQHREDHSDTLALKDLLLEQLGVNDPEQREGLAHAMTVEGIQNAMRTFAEIPEHVARRIVEVHPELVSPTRGINLPSFVSELKDFLHQAYDLEGYPAFDPMLNPSNFADPAALKRVKRAANIVRRAAASVSKDRTDR
jgi:hypothetical protein